jgi:hypothetical protein
MILRALVVALAGVTIFAAAQTYRVGQLKEKAETAETCEEVRDINERIRNETDDELLRRVTRPE